MSTIRCRGLPIPLRRGDGGLFYMGFAGEGSLPRFFLLSDVEILCILFRDSSGSSNFLCRANEILSEYIVYNIFMMLFSFAFLFFFDNFARLNRKYCETI